MNSGIWPFGRWGSEQRCEQAVVQAAALLGMDVRGTGHLRALYRAAYADGLRDAYEQIRGASQQAAEGVAGGWLAWGGREPPADPVPEGEQFPVPQ